MAYKALYRTYRPQKFSEVIGQDAIVRTLQNALATGKFTHAYLFSGPRGTGKTTVARIFAKALNCDQSPTSEPCGECTSCQEITECINPDVIEIDAASNNGVDEIRDIREKVKFLPGGSKYKIYIIDEVHMLSQGAFNALLKTLEEPPKHVIFILATTEPYKVIPTILSRCQRYDFKSLSVKVIKEQLGKVAKTENMKISDEALIAIAESAEGGMRDAFSYLDQAASFADDEITIDDVNSVTGNLNYDKTIELAEYLEAGNINQALATINDLLAAGKEISKIVSGILQFYRDLLLFKNVDTSTSSKYIYEKPAFRALAEKINEAKIFYYVDTISDVQAKIKTSITPHIYLEVAIIKMINVGEQDLDFMKRFKVLEEEISSLKQATPTSQDEAMVSNDKVNDIEYRLNRVVQELSKLELHKLSDRLGNLEKASLPSDSSQGMEEINRQLNQIQEQIRALNEVTTKQQAAMNQSLATSPAKNVDQDELREILQEELQGIKQKITKLESINHNLPPNLPPSSLTEEWQTKINVLENKVYKLMSNVLAPVPKKTKKKTNEGQIVLFGDEVTTLEALEKPTKIQIDFAELQKEEVKAPATTEAEEKETTEKQVEEAILETVETEKEPLTKTAENLVLGELKVADFQEAKPKTVQTTILENQEIIDRPHSQLVRKINPEKPELEHMSVKDLEDNVKLTHMEKPEPITKPVVQEEQKPRLTIAKMMEKILHETRSEAARHDKPRIMKLWDSLDKTTNADYRLIAELLQEGSVAAVGDKALVIVYPNAMLCNQVMKPKFKKEALRMLYNYLGDAYDYLAIPDYLWKEKRSEYVNQYNIGTTYPVLSEIDDPSLIFEDEDNEVRAIDKQIDQVKSLFGDDFVKVE